MPWLKKLRNLQKAADVNNILRYTEVSPLGLFLLFIFGFPKPWVKLISSANHGKKIKEKEEQVLV